MASFQCVLFTLRPKLCCSLKTIFFAHFKLIWSSRKVLIKSNSKAGQIMQSTCQDSSSFCTKVSLCCGRRAMEENLLFNLYGRLTHHNVDGFLKPVNGSAKLLFSFAKPLPTVSWLKLMSCCCSLCSLCSLVESPISVLTFYISQFQSRKSSISICCITNVHSSTSFINPNLIYCKESNSLVAIDVTWSLTKFFTLESFIVT